MLAVSSDQKLITNETFSEKNEASQPRRREKEREIRRLKREEEAAKRPARLVLGSGVAGAEGSVTRGGTLAFRGKGGGGGAAGGGWFWPLLLLLLG